MSKLTLNEIRTAMKKLDVCMLTTRNAEGALESRPMSNNKDVDYHGDSYFFTLADTRAVKDIAENPQVCMAYDGRPGLLSKPLYLCIAGTAEIIRDRAVMEQHWVPDLERWFKNGLDTPGITLIHVQSSHIRYWQGFDEGEIDLGHRAAAA